MDFYHITNQTNYQMIQASHQLRPMVGPRSQKLGETMPRIYLFNTWSACNEGVSQWLGDEFDETDTLMYIKIHLNQHDSALIYQPDFYESYYVKSIPIQNLQLIQIEPPS